MTPTAISAFARMTALSGRNDDPEHASRPFDVARDGFVMGEGAAILILERWDRAVARGAKIYGEVAGYGRNADAYHITAPSPGGEGAAACMQLALDDAGIDASEVGHVNAHGTSTPLNDAAEAEAIRKVFGDGAPPVTSTKGVTGHLIGACSGSSTVRSRRPPTSSSSATTSNSTSSPARLVPSTPPLHCRTRSGSAATTSR
jgi:3-oxoacyl-[acyl-carrier-protein] synthase II